MSGKSWFDAMDQLLLAMRGKHSSAEIADELNRRSPHYGGVSRSAVLGRVDRLRKLGMTLEKLPARVPKRNTIVPQSVPAEAAVPPHRDNSNGCRWIEGDLPGDACGQPVHNSSSWCQAHHDRVFTPKKRKEQAA